jgi:hypothetical protein
VVTQVFTPFASVQVGPLVTGSVPAATLVQKPTPWETEQKFTPVHRAIFTEPHLHVAKFSEPSDFGQPEAGLGPLTFVPSAS